MNCRHENCRRKAMPSWALLGVAFSTRQAVLTLIGVPVALAVCWFAIVVAWAVWS